MKNQDMPARPSTNWADSEELVSQFDGETKYEKAFWQVYSAFLSNSNVDTDLGVDGLSKAAIKAVNAGFKALEKRND